MGSGWDKARSGAVSVVIGLAIIAAACSQSLLKPETISSPSLSASPVSSASPGPSLEGRAGPGTPSVVPLVLTPSSTSDVKGPSFPLEGFSSKAAYRHVEHLAVAIGSRPTGGDKERAASEYIAVQLRSYGYTVEVQEFQFPDFEDRGSRLEVVSHEAQELEPSTLFYSAGGQVKGLLFDAGMGRTEDSPPEKMKGKVALVERGGEVGGRAMTFAQKTDNAAASGAIGIIIYNNRPGPFRGSLQNLSAIPAVALSQKEGQALKALLAEGDVTVNLVVDAELKTHLSQNVVAKGGDGCTVLVGGHYDSVAQGPGANDNASGTAVVLELARIARLEAKERGFCFAAFGGEELGLWGSRRYVEAMTSEERAAMAGMVNLDMVGVGDRWGLAGSEKLADLGLQEAEKESIEAGPFTLPRSSGSDHGSFMAVGIPAVFIHLLDDPNYHTAQDKAEFVSQERLEEAGKIARGILMALASP